MKKKIIISLIVLVCLVGVGLTVKCFLGCSGTVKIITNGYQWQASKPDGSIIKWSMNAPDSLAEDLLNSKIVDIAYSNEQLQDKYISSGNLIALKKDGSAIMWHIGGFPWSGSDNGPFTAKDKSFTNLVKVVTGYPEFIALKKDGSVVSLKLEDSKDKSDEKFIFAILKKSGSVIFGNESNKEELSNAKDKFKDDIIKIVVTNNIYMNLNALQANKEIITIEKRNSSLWDNKSELDSLKEKFFGNNIIDIYPKYIDFDSVKDQLTSGVVDIVATKFAYAALKKDGSVVTWGDSNYGGDFSIMNKDTLSSGVKKITSTSSEFFALKIDGSVVTTTRDLSNAGLIGVSDIYASHRCFIAQKKDRSIFGWTQDYRDKKVFKNISKIVPKDAGFVLSRKDGNYFYFGDVTQEKLDSYLK